MDQIKESQTLINWLILLAFFLPRISSIQELSWPGVVQWWFTFFTGFFTVFEKYCYEQIFKEFFFTVSYQFHFSVHLYHHPHHPQLAMLVTQVFRFDTQENEWSSNLSQDSSVFFLRFSSKTSFVFVFHGSWNYVVCHLLRSLKLYFIKEHWDMKRHCFVCVYWAAV